jgi:hypothetical protein
LASTGTIWQYSSKTITTNPTNKIPLSIANDKTPFNGGQGWKTGYNLDAGTGEETTTQYTKYYEVTGFIPFTIADVLRVKNITIDATTYDNFCFYNANFGFLKSFTGSSNYNPTSQFKLSDGTYEWDLNKTTKTNMTEAQKQLVAYVRVSASKIDNTSFATVNESLEPVTTVVSDWYDTGLKYQDTSEDVARLEAEIEELKVSCDKLLRYMGLHK